MARMPGATWIGPTVNRTKGGMGTIVGLVLHIQQGYESGSEAWFKNPDAKASAHFLNPKTGQLRQLVDTADKAWAQADGNYHWISIENEGFAPGDALTASQLDNAAHLLAWLHTTDNVPLRATDDPDGHGLGWHGMGGKAWGNHPDCPGPKVRAQRAEILTRAAVLLDAPPPPASLYQPFPGASFFTTGHTSPIIGAMHNRLVKVGCNRYRTHTNLNTWGSGDTASYQAWQLHLFPGASTAPGGAADGVPGRQSWDRLQVPRVV